MNNFLVNPAIAGIEKFIDIQAGYRSQWQTLEGGPSSIHFSGHGVLGKIRGKKMGFTKTYEANEDRRSVANYKYKVNKGIGLKFISESIGPFQVDDLSGAFAVHLPVSKNLMVALGTSVGFGTRRLNNSKINTTQAIDPAIDDYPNDTYPTISSGVWVYAESFYVGGSINHAYNNGERIENKFIAGGVRFRDDFNIWTFTPYTLIHFYEDRNYFDLGIKAYWDSRLWLGINYRSVKSTSAFLGFNVNPTLGFSALSNFYFKGSTATSRTTNEIIIFIRLNNKSRMLCPQEMW